MHLNKEDLNMWEYNYNYYSDDELMHYGVVGMKWGKRKAKAEYRATKKKAKAAYRKAIDNGGDWDVEADRYNATVSAAKKKYKKTVGAPKAAYKAAKKKADAAYTKAAKKADRTGDYSHIDAAADKWLADRKAAKQQYKTAKMSPKQRAMAEYKAKYKAAKKKADQRYLNSKEGEDIAGDKWVAERKAIKQQYKADKKAYRAEARAAVNEAKSQYKAAKKKADNAYTKSATAMDKAGNYDGVDAAADKWIADRKAAKSKYKAVKRRYS